MKTLGVKGTRLVRLHKALWKGFVSKGTPSLYECGGKQKKNPNPGYPLAKFLLNVVDNVNALRTSFFYRLKLWKCVNAVDYYWSSVMPNK